MVHLYYVTIYYYWFLWIIVIFHCGKLSFLFRIMHIHYTNRTHPCTPCLSFCPTEWQQGSSIISWVLFSSSRVQLLPCQSKKSQKFLWTCIIFVQQSFKKSTGGFFPVKGQIQGMKLSSFSTGRMNTQILSLDRFFFSPGEDIPEATRQFWLNFSRIKTSGIGHGSVQSFIIS